MGPLEWQWRWHAVAKPSQTVQRRNYSYVDPDRLQCMIFPRADLKAISNPNRVRDGSSLAEEKQNGSVTTNKSNQSDSEAHSTTYSILVSLERTLRPSPAFLPSSCVCSVPPQQDQVGPKREDIEAICHHRT